MSDLETPIEVADRAQALYDATDELMRSLIEVNRAPPGWLVDYRIRLRMLIARGSGTLPSPPPELAGAGAMTRH